MSKEKLKEQVRDILINVPEARNCDKRLAVELWKKFYGVDLEIIMDLPAVPGMKRIRADFQNDKKLYPPTRSSVAKARGWEEREWRILLGYPVVEEKGQMVFAGEGL